MSTLAEQLQAILNPLAAGGSWPLVAAQGTPAPYITYEDSSPSTTNTLGGATDMQNTRMQINAFHTTYAAAQVLAKSIIAAMAAAAFTNLQLSGQTRYDADTMLYRAQLEFSIWSTA
jgi:hypothetical protein